MNASPSSFLRLPISMSSAVLCLENLQREVFSWGALGRKMHTFTTPIVMHGICWRGRLGNESMAVERGDERAHAEDGHEKQASKKPEHAGLDFHEPEVTFVHRCEELWVHHSRDVDGESEHIDHDKHDEVLPIASEQLKTRLWRGKETA